MLDVKKYVEKKILWATNWAHWKFHTIIVRNSLELPRMWCQGGTWKEPWCKSGGKSLAWTKALQISQWVVCQYKFVQLFLLEQSVHCFRKEKQWSETLILFNKATCVWESGWGLGFHVGSWHAGKPKKSHLFPIKTMLLSLQPRFWKRDDCPRVILGTYPDYSSRIAVLTQSCLFLKWNSTADSEQLSQTEKSIYWNNTGEFWSLSHLEHSGGCSSIVRSAFAEAVLWTSWSHVPIPLAHWLWSGVSQHLHSVHSSVLFPAFHAGPDQITVGLLLISWLVPLTSS